ncbi:MAG TPA: hypothetical protein VK781_10255 [Solirubrobacteraceae bacterium]|nr:hypothetical protein [Solirubrobacteraceae bacterium]
MYSRLPHCLDHPAGNVPEHPIPVVVGFLAVDAWTFIWLMVFLKIPIVGLFLIVRWAVRQTPEASTGEDGGIGPHPGPLHPHHPRRRLPRAPRRGPHGDAPLTPPSRVRTVAARGRLAQR